MPEIKINPLFNVHDKYNRVNIINPYRFGNETLTITPFDNTNLLSNARNSVATFLDFNKNIQTSDVNGVRIDYRTGTAKILSESGSNNLFTKSEPTSSEGSTLAVTYQAYDWGIGLTRVVVFGDNSTTRLHYGGSVTAGITYTISVFIIMDDLSVPIYSDLQLRVGGGIVQSSEFSVIHITGNIYKISGYREAPSTNGNNGVAKLSSNSPKGFKVIGFHLETGIKSTSYIKTAGATATRAADNITTPVPSWATKITTTVNGANQVIDSNLPTVYTLPFGNIEQIKFE